MKTIIATTATFLMLTSTAWADEPKDARADTADRIVLSDAEMDGVTAGLTVGQSTLWWRISDANTTVSTSNTASFTVVNNHLKSKGGD